ncbi:MAG TPA: glycosyltransferase, partial [Chitinophagales bacterium]|nr:glycosyltransferase [Chitinophagales bacterium]
MLKNKSVAVVVPAYNEEKQIVKVLESIPSFVDRIIVVNDCSTDRTAECVRQFIESDRSERKIIQSKLKNEPVLTLYNKAEQVLHTKSKEEIKFFNPSEIANENPETDRIILINHKVNGGVGGAIATGYKWCKDHDIDC